jgi:hypothetical protein
VTRFQATGKLVYFLKNNTVKPLSIVFEGDGKQKRYIQENDSTGKSLKIIDENNLMIITVYSRI